jgi:phosphoribosylanthranilate isomerase
MKQQLLEELEALRDAHRTARSQDDFDALLPRVQMIEVLSASASERSKAEKAALERVKTVVSDAVEAKRKGQDQPTNLSATVFALMQAVRRGTTGYDR